MSIAISVGMEYQTSLQLTIELLFDHFNFVVAIICVDVFQHHTVVIPPLESICFGHTTVDSQESTNGSGIHAEVQVPFRNFNFGNNWSLTAMEKAMALPLRAGFMPNLPMPMLDVSNWLLLTTVLTTGGGRIPPLLVLEIFSLLLCGFFFRITLDTTKVHDQFAVTSHGRPCV